MNRKTMLRRLTALALLVGLLIGTAAPAAMAASEQQAAPKAVVVGTTTKVSGDFFTGHFGNNTSDIDVRTLVHGYAPTVWQTQWSFVVDNTVVKALDVKKHNKVTTYTVTLQDGLTYNDGKTPITAADYAFSLLLQASPAFAALGANADRLAYVAGYESYRKGETVALSGVRVVDASTFSVDVKNTYLPYFYHLSYLNFYPYPISVLAPGFEVMDTQEGAVLANAQKQPVALSEAVLQSTVAGEKGYLHWPTLSAGPWKLEAYDQAGGVVELVKNEHYAGNFEGQKPAIDTLRLVPVYQDNMMKALHDGEVTVINKLSNGEVIQALLDAKEADHAMYPRLGYGFLAFNPSEGRPFASVYVRRALSHALQKEKLAQDFTRGFGRAIYGYYGLGQWEVLATEGTLTPGSMGVRNTKWNAQGEAKLEKYPHSMEEANALLVKAGWALNESGKPFTLGQDQQRYRKTEAGMEALTVRFLASENNAAVTLLMEQFKAVEAATGMHIDVVTVPFVDLLKAYYQKPENKDYDFVFLATNFLSSFDPSSDFGIREEQLGIVNNAAHQDKELEALAWDMRKTEPMQFNAYLGRWQRFQEKYAKSLPTLPLYSNHYFDFFSPDLQNYQPDRHPNWPAAMLYATVK